MRPKPDFYRLLTARINDSGHLIQLRVSLRTYVGVKRLLQIRVNMGRSVFYRPDKVDKVFE